MHILNFLKNLRIKNIKMIKYDIKDKFRNLLAVRHQGIDFEYGKYDKTGDINYEIFRFLEKII